MISMIRVVLYNLIELLTCYIGNEIIIKVPFSKKRLCIIIVMITDVVSVVLYKIFINRGYEDVITLLIILIMPLCCEKKNWKKTFPLAVIIMMITDLINSFVLYIISGIMSKDYTNYYNFSFLSLFGRSFSLIVFIIYYKFYLKNSYNKKMIAIKSYQSLILICGLLCCCIMFAGYFVVMQDIGPDKTSISIIGIAVMTLCFIFFAILVRYIYISRQNELMKYREECYKYFMYYQQEYFRQLTSKYDEIRSFRHDINGHIIVLKDYAYRIARNIELEEKKHDAMKKTEEMIAYINKMTEICDSYIQYTYTGITSVDAIINELKKKCANENILFKHSGMIFVREELSEYDLCTIIYNILQNSIEGVLKLPENERIIEIVTLNYNKKIYICAKNKCTGLPDTEKIVFLETDKPDSRNHGIGMRNISKSVSIYNGVTNYSVEDNWFIVEIII